MTNRDSWRLFVAILRARISSERSTHSSRGFPIPALAGGNRKWAKTGRADPISTSTILVDSIYSFPLINSNASVPKT